MSILSRKCIDAINQLNDKNTLYVLRGFNFLTSDLQVEKDRFLFYKDAIIDDEKYQPDNLIKRFSSGDSLFCLFEDLLWLDSKNFSGIFEMSGYKTIVVDNDYFHGIYPDFPTRSYDKIKRFDADIDNLTQKYYSAVSEVDGNIYIIYNDYRGQISETISISQAIDSSPANNDLELTIPDDPDNVLLASTIRQLFFDDYSRVSVLLENRINNIVIKSLVEKMNAFGLKVFDRKYAVDQYQLADGFIGAYEDILHRKNPEFKFKDIPVYEDPYNSNKLVPVNQSVIIDRVVQNALLAQQGQSFRDVFVTAPTGSGKSVMFQIPAIYLAEQQDLVTIVISPLIGLMNDQLSNIRTLTDKARVINSDYTPIEKEQALLDLKDGNASILYLSPESLLSNTDITNLIGDRKIGLVVVDESHIVATWGKSFRPDYWYLGEFIAKLRSSDSEHRFPIATFTATATISNDADNMYSEIVESLRMTSEKFIGNIKRDDISFDIRKHEKKNDYRGEKMEIASAYINKQIQDNNKTLIYVPYTRQISELYAKINDTDKVGQYYGGMNPGEKNETLRNIGDNTISTVIATKAFGMGIDIDDIQTVYHFAPTGNVADYVQEIGRAARRPDIDGIASTDFYKEDFRYINALYGMSSLKNWQIIAVLQKILELYKRQAKRNLLVSPLEFSYIFADTPPDQVDARLKTALLIIKKDFEMMSNNSFVPLVFKPRSMFTAGFFMVNDDIVGRLETMGIMKYFKKLPLPRKIQYTEMDGTPTTSTSPGDTYELNLKGLWENKFRHMTFASFKYALHTNTLDGFDLNVGSKVVVRTIINIDTGTRTLGQSADALKSFADSMIDIFDDLRQSGKTFTARDLSILIRERTAITKSYVADLAAQSIIHILNRIPINNFNQSNFTDFNSQTNRFIIKNTTYETRLRRLYGRGKRMLFPYEANHATRYAGSDIKDNLDVLLGQVLQILELAIVDISSGSSPEFFIRVNSPSTIERIINNASYVSKTVILVGQKHKESVALMEKFFTELDTDEARWNFIESYFLGKIEVPSRKIDETTDNATEVDSVAE